MVTLVAPRNGDDDWVRLQEMKTGTHAGLMNDHFDNDDDFFCNFEEWRWQLSSTLAYQTINLRVKLEINQ